ncbi:hypothetical protein [Novosphingobium sp. 9U]|uniref:hypothetical protein n=1 Tax=Novosphingobium sp. 9U TaxID=2653158 RepID=UPI001F19E225|nr:hypothetical protein [Novosphingobium sp. 9U]
MKWLNSLDELLYEVMSWLLFFPITLWRATVGPLRLMAEVEQQAALPDEEQYGSILSPPLFLALSLLLAHAGATALGQSDALIADNHGLASLVDDDATALVVRVAAFAGFALSLAARLVRSRRLALSRLTLRQPFYEQCYPSAVFALGLGIGTSLILVPNGPAHAAGRLLAVASLTYFAIVEVRWFAAARGISHVRALGHVVLATSQALVLMLIIGFLFTR